MERLEVMTQLAFDYPSEQIGSCAIAQADCFEWLTRVPENSIHAVVTDPPYGVKEYDFEQIAKRENGNGGIWRIPPSFDGHQRSPLPSIKPQSFLRQVVYASLPLGEGIIVDTFMGSGSTVAAAEAMGVRCIGIERYQEYYEMSRTAILKLAALKIQTNLKALTENNDLKTATEKIEDQQLTLW